MAADRAWRRPARRIARTRARRRLWRGPPDRRGRPARRRADRIDRLHRRDARRRAARQALAQALRRRHRPRPRRALVGAGRSRPGALGLRLRAGEPPRHLAGVLQPLQPDERRAPGAVLSRVARRAQGERRAQRAAHRHSDARTLERDLFRAGLSRALPRLPARRRRRSRHARGPRLRAHDRRLEALRRAVAPCRRRMVRSARTQRRLAHRRARPDRRDPRRRRRGREHAGRRAASNRARCWRFCPRSPAA